MAKPEEEIVALIRRTFDDPQVTLGIGDDAAVFNASGPMIVTTDLLVEDIDFTSETPIEFVARKSLAANVSDLAAMGATPDVFLLALAIPDAYRSLLPRFFEAMSDAARNYGIRLIGGDLSGGAKFTIGITAMGRAEARTLLRSKAQAGDRIYLSRPVGGAAAGFTLWSKGWRMDSAGNVASPPGGQTTWADREFGGAAIRQFLNPTAEVRLGPQLGSDETVHACIDLSDGLSSDLRRLCIASGVAARIEWERLPIFPELEKIGRGLGITPEDAALHGGEEIALLFTSTSSEYDLSSRLVRPVYMIGEIKAGSGITLARGNAEVELADYGFDHFSTLIAQRSTLNERQK
jgi:thiamine-monophosphate kinase